MSDIQISQAGSGPAPAPTSVAAAAPSNRALRAAIVLALFGLGVTLGHFLWPSPLMFTLFMIVGQGAFGLAMVIYAWVILSDLRRRRAL